MEKPAESGISHVTGVRQLTILVSQFCAASIKYKIFCHHRQRNQSGLIDVTYGNQAFPDRRVFKYRSDEDGGVAIGIFGG